jgi:prefoldin subunit 5
MTQQEMVDQIIRLQLGDLMVQIAALKAQVAQLEMDLAQARTATQTLSEIIVESKPNGHEKRVDNG